jgi:hypothetical protein
VYFLWDRLLISRKGGFSCPVKTLALFVHNQDFYFTDIFPKPLRLSGDCNASSADVIFFNQDFYSRKQLKHPARLVLWMKFSIDSVEEITLVSAPKSIY